MNTEIVKIDINNIDNVLMDKMGNILNNGGLVAFPTETVYGLGANAFNEEALRNIYKAKGRPSDNPLIVHFYDIVSCEKVMGKLTDEARLLFEKFSPGPLTVIVKNNGVFPSTVTAGLDTVAIRIPSHKIASELIKASGVPVAAPSANLSGKPSPTCGKDVINDMNTRIEAIIDGGNSDVGVESTIIDVSEKPAKILRPGGITYEQIKEYIKDVEFDKDVFSAISNDEKPKCPGTKYKHYAPDAQVVVVEGEEKEVVRKISELIADNADKKIGVMALGDYKYDVDIIIKVGSNNREYAKNLFRSLREFDENKIDIVYAEFFVEDSFSITVKNRLYKSAGNTVIYV